METTLQYQMLREAYRQQRAFNTHDPRYLGVGRLLEKRGYIICLNDRSPRRLWYENWWEPTQAGYRIFLRWKRLKSAESKE